MYEEDDRDVNVLKTVLPLMSRHAAGYHPISYAVWYEYAKGARPELRQNVDSELARSERLTVALTYSIYSRYLVEPAEQALMTARTNLLELAGQVKNAVHDANRDTAGFDARLNEFQHELSTATTIQDLGGHVTSMLAETRRVSDSFGRLNSQLEHSRTEVRRLTEELHRIREDATTDVLSGLLNRRGFDRELNRLAPRGTAPEGALALIMFDIDHFKTVNDTYGHPLGDRVIAAVGQLIRECLGKAGVAARYGGEEFAVLLASHRIEIAERMAQTIRQRIELGTIRRRHGEEPVGGVTVSAGVAVWRPEDDTATLIERADRALYASKRAGRNRVTVDRLPGARSDQAPVAVEAGGAPS
ncbi:MAG TPA: GGDEF domain-containing protein [Burkholderiaceae bacterium]|jgi:diguanylate cyclase|nr:GGDEF domain-containing protein [Burkholderiaceae bacterium]